MSTSLDIVRTNKNLVFFKCQQWFIKNFSKIARLLTNLLAKDASFTFDTECMNSWKKLKRELILIISALDWSKPFEIMCDASDFAIGAVLGQRIDNKHHVIYYSSTTLNDAQMNYITTEKEFLAVVFTLEKFCPYLLGSKTTIFTDHSALRYLMMKKDAKAWLSRWILLLQEFDLEIWDKKGIENIIADHLSRIPNAHATNFPSVMTFSMKTFSFLQGTLVFRYNELFSHKPNFISLV